MRKTNLDLASLDDNCLRILQDCVEADDIVSRVNPLLNPLYGDNVKDTESMELLISLYTL